VESDQSVPPAPAEAPVFNPLDPELAANPFPILARLRAYDPVFDASGAFVVTGHDEAREVLRRKDGDLRWEQFQKMRQTATAPSTSRTSV
jgi:cytochrome P450